PMLAGAPHFDDFFEEVHALSQPSAYGASLVMSMQVVKTGLHSCKQGLLDTHSLRVLPSDSQNMAGG
ncbi:MAG: hypothetical protein WB543_02550, partial [Candidatus Acidiferrum sp.]